MKKIARFIVAFFLSLLARAVVKRYKPKIVMITGSVGKTSTKDAVAEVLSKRFFIGKSEKSFNSEFGVPFTILGVENPWNNPMAWFSLLKRAMALLFLPNHYPNMLVLEVGADKPRDLYKILKIATPDAVVVTRLPEVPVHVEAYSCPEAVREEEFSPAYALPASAPLIISTDDDYAREASVRTPARVISYGTSDDSFIHISNIDFYREDNKVVGMKAKVSIGDENYREEKEIIIRGSVGETQVLPVASALALASAFEINIDDAIKALEAYVPPPGRGRLLSGINNSIIIDDSYNASPVAVEKALETLKSFPNASRRIAVLGDMLELGRYSVEEHNKIGKIARQSADIVVAVGVRSRVFQNIEGNAEVIVFNTAKEAGEALRDIVREGDIILVKGSQSIRTERIVSELLTNKEDSKLLVRQERRWQNKL